MYDSLDVGRVHASKERNDEGRLKAGSVLPDLIRADTALQWVFFVLHIYHYTTHCGVCLNLLFKKRGGGYVVFVDSKALNVPPPSTTSRGLYVFLLCGTDLALRR